jgi:dolichol kinase
MADVTTYLADAPRTISREITTELIRKLVHMLVATVPLIVSQIGTVATLFLLGAGTILYTWAEVRRQRGHNVPVITRITNASLRPRDTGHFVLGPVTLGVGAMLALLLYPDPAATVAIYALAFGDAIASIVGKAVGRISLPFTGGKTLEGSLACATVVAIAAFLVLGSWPVALIVAITAALLEALPTKDIDNLILPMGVGLITFLLV